MSWPQILRSSNCSRPGTASESRRFLAAPMAKQKQLLLPEAMGTTYHKVYVRPKGIQLNKQYGSVMLKKNGTVSGRYLQFWVMSLMQYCIYTNSDSVLHCLWMVLYSELWFYMVLLCYYCCECGKRSVIITIPYRGLWSWVCPYGWDDVKWAANGWLIGGLINYWVYHL